MPGLRFKKRAARRHTIDNLEQNAKEIEAAKVEQAQKKKENEKFMQLFKSKYPNHAKDVNFHADDVKDGNNHVRICQIFYVILWLLPLQSSQHQRCFALLC